ncbi:MAG: helix-turn-helix transcriptional regulator [Candidatus Hydrogenedentales bacterium]|jgi:transcriptional regulator with XRE-family HTH domain
MDKQENLPETSKRLRELRSAKEKTVLEAALEMGISRASLSNAENGLRLSPTLAHILAAYYEVEVSEFWTAPTLPIHEQQTVVNAR